MNINTEEDLARAQESVKNSNMDEILKEVDPQDPTTDEYALPIEGMVSLSPQYANPSIYFYENNEPVMVIKKGKFVWMGEEIEDTHDIYERFNEWLIRTNSSKPTPQDISMVEAKAYEKGWKDGYDEGLYDGMYK